MVLVYSLHILLVQVLPGVLGVTREVYTAEDVYCWSDAADGSYPDSFIALQVRKTTSAVGGNCFISHW